MPKPPLVGRRRYLNDIDEEHALEDRAELERAVEAYENWLNRAPLMPDLPDPAWDERDPYDKLREEGGYIGE